MWPGKHWAWVGLGVAELSVSGQGTRMVGCPSLYATPWGGESHYGME